MGRGGSFIGQVAALAGLILGLVLGSTAFGAPLGAALGPGVLAVEARDVEPADLGPAGPGSPNSKPAPAHPARTWVSGMALIAAGAAGWWVLKRKLADPRPPEAEPPPLSGDRGPIPWPLMMLAGLVVWLAQPLGAGSAAALCGLSAADSATLRGSALALLGSCAGALIAASVAILATPGLARTIGLRPTAGAARRGLGAFCLIMPVVFAVAIASMSLAAWIARWRGSAAPEELAHGTLRLIAAPSAGDGVWWTLTVFAVVIGAPIVEELVYRGLFQSGLRNALAGKPTSPRAAGWGGILGSSMVFALMHASIAEPHALPTLLVLSIALGIVYERNGRLVAPVIVHGLFNAANIALVWLPG